MSSRRPGAPTEPLGQELGRPTRAQQLAELGEHATELQAELMAALPDLDAPSPEPADRDRITDALIFAYRAHAGQRRLSGEPYIDHPVEVAKICASMQLDTATLCAALLHDVVEDTDATLDDVSEHFGDEVSLLVDGVTKLSGLTFQSRDEAQAENYRKMIVAMAADIRVVLIKLADRLHNMRTIGAMGKQKQIEKARESLDIYAPIAHRLGIHAIKWELEDLAFQTLHPRKYNEIKVLVAQQRAERERYVEQAADYLRQELEDVGMQAEISGRAKHFYSIYSKMTKKGREFNEIYDLTAMRVIVDSVKDCYGVVGIIHSLWKPLPGRFKDYIAMPKFNMYQSLHTTVIGPEGRPLEIQIRTREMHDLAEYGIAAHWMYKEDPNAAKGGRSRGAAAALRDPEGKLKWLRSLVDWQKDVSDPREFVETLKVDLFEDDVFVFTPKGEVKSLAAGATPLDFAYEIHTDVGHRCVGAKVNGKIVPLSYQLHSGDIVEVLTSKRERGPSRDWLSLVKTSRARNKIKAWFKAESRRDTEHAGREQLQEALRKQGLPAQKLVSSPLMADVIREMGYRKGDDFYIALGSGKISPQVVINKVMQRLKAGEAAESKPTAAADLLSSGRRRRKATTSSNHYGIAVDGIDEVMLRLAKCCHPVPGDEIVGYISLGRGITVHRADCPNVAVLKKDPERFTGVSWEGDADSAFQVEIEVQGWDRYRLLEDMARSFAEAGVNILEARCTTNHPMIRNQFVVEVADSRSLDQAINRLRNIDNVFDVYRITPGAGG